MKHSSTIQTSKLRGAFEKHLTAIIVCLIMAIIFLMPMHSKAQQFTAGNIAVLQGPNDADPDTISIVEINPLTGALVNTFTTASPYRNGISSGTIGRISNSNDGSLVCVAGVDTIYNSGTNTSISKRWAGSFNASGTFALGTTYAEGNAAGQTRSATTVNNTTWFIADKNGLYTNNEAGTSGSPSANIETVKAFGGTVYVGNAQTNPFINTISAPGGSYSALPGITIGDANLLDFYLVQSRAGLNGNSTSTYDILYVLMGKSASKDTIYKYCYSTTAGTWVPYGVNTTGYAGTTGGIGLAAQMTTTGDSAYLYMTTGASTSGNTLIRLTDASGYDANINITTANNITLYTAPSTGGNSGDGFIIKGVAFAPGNVSSSPTSGSGFDYAQGTGPSSAQGFKITGNFLTLPSGTITVNGSTDFEVSTTSASSGFGSSATIAYTGNWLYPSSVNVWVRLKAGLTSTGGTSSNGTYNNETISISGGGGSASITVSGTVTAGTPSVSLNQDISQVSSDAHPNLGTDVTLSDFDVAVANANTTLTGLTFTPGGTFVAGDIADFYLYTSTSATFPGYGSPVSTVSGSGISSGGTVTFPSIGTSCNTSGNTYFWIAALVASQGVGHTVSVPALASGAFTFSSGSISGDVITAATAQTISTTSYYWNGGLSSALSSNWDNTTNNWNTTGTGSPNTTWPATGNYIANFSNAGGGTVTIPGAIAATPYQTVIGTNNVTFTATATASLGGAISLGTNTLTLTPSSALTLSGPISGSGGITYNGSGTSLITNTSNSFSGQLLITDGAISYAADAAIGTDNIAINGGRLTVSANNTISSGRNIYLGSASGTSISTTGSSVVTYNGVMADLAGHAPGFWGKQGGGTLILGGNSTYTGATNVNNATVQLGISGALPSTTILNIGQSGSANTGIFDLHGFNQTVAGLASTIGTSVVTTNTTTNLGTSASTLTIALSGGNTYTYGSSSVNNSGVITDNHTNGGSLAITLSGSGKEIFGGINTYAGATTIGTGATLDFTPNANETLTGAANLTGGTLSTIGIGNVGATLSFNALTLNGNSTLSLDPATDHTIQFSGFTPTSGTLTITGWQGSYDGTNNGNEVGVIIFTSDITAGLGSIQFKDASNNIFSSALINNGDGTYELVANLNTSPYFTATPATLTSFGDQLVSTTSVSAESFNLSGSNLTGFPGTITFTAPADFEVSTDGGSTYSAAGGSKTLSYSSATLSATTIYVKFSPQTGGSKSEKVVISGGGVVVPDSVTVSGTAEVAYISTATGGNWSSGSTWMGGIAPTGTAADNVTITSGATVTLDANDKGVSTLTINGTLSMPNSTDTLTVLSGGTTTVNGALNITESSATTTGLFTSPNLVVTSGASFNNSAGIATAVSITNFNVENGGSYIHNAMGSTSAGANSDFPGGGATTATNQITLGNSSTVTIEQWGQAGGNPNALPAVSYGNLTIDVTNAYGVNDSWGQGGGITAINGNFIAEATGETFFRFVKSQTIGQVAIGGDFDVTGSAFVGLTNASAAGAFPKILVAGNLNVSGNGVLDLDSASVAGNEILELNGNLTVSGNGIIQRDGIGTATATVYFNNPSGTQSFTSTGSGINSNKVTWIVGDPNGAISNTLQLNSDFKMSTASSLTVNSGSSVVLGASKVHIDSALVLNGTLNINGDTLQLDMNTPVTGSGSITGSTASNLILKGGTAGVGTINFTNNPDVLKSLTLSTAGSYSTTSATLGSNMLNISDNGVLTVNTGATLNTNNNITILSDIGGTGSVANSAGTISGNAIVQRYIPDNGTRAWRLLSVPTQTTQTIANSWQESTQITSTATGNGFDGPAQPYPSMLTYNPGTNTWSGVTATTDDIATTSGYFLYVRGDRSVTPSSSTSTTSSTTLSTTGPLYQGTQTAITVPSGEFGLIGNTYASAINFTNLTNSEGIDQLFYVWDPKALNLPPSLGGYITFSATNSWEPVPAPAGGSYTPDVANTTIQSGQAFFVHASSTGTVQLTESSKVSGSQEVFRPATISNRLTTNLYEVDSSLNLADGNVEVFNPAYPDSLNGNDALKLDNTQENFGILRDSKVLVIEARQPVVITDTIFFDMWNMKQMQYQLQFVPNNLSTPGLTAYLKDNYLGTSTAIDLTNGSTANFTVDANAASSASNRFDIVFNNATPVPVTFAGIQASQKNTGVVVNWQVAGENGIKQYEVERSTDGVNFTAIGTVTASGLSAYSFTDAAPVTGNNFYRVMSVGVTGVEKYSSIVKVGIGLQPGVAVYPNPVTGGKIGLQLTNMPEGTYNVRLLSIIGQELYRNTVNHSGGSSTETLTVPSGVAKGIYKLEVVAPDNTSYTQKLILN